MQIKPCQPYAAQLLRPPELVRMPDRRSAFKVYFLSITGRAEPARYEWGVGPERPEDFLARLASSAQPGIGFATVFKHIAKIFRFDPAAETVLHVKALRTADLAPLDLARGEGFCEFACYAEAVLAAAEYRAWAQALTVEEYLAGAADLADGRIAAHAKLAHYCHATY